MTKALLCIKMLYKNISRSNRKIVLEDEIDSYKKFPYNISVSEVHAI